MDNYEVLLGLLEQHLKKNSDFVTKSRIGSCKNQMTLLKFYFGLNLNQRFYAITGNLSKTLQKGKMSALRGKVLIDLIVQTLKNMRNEHEFNLLYKNIKVLASEIDAISPPSLPRK